MAFALEIGKIWKDQGWRVKIADKEYVEPPHVTIILRIKKWRINLRTGAFMDKNPPPREVPRGLVDEVKQHMEELVQEWDRMYPSNPVESGHSHDKT